ncbi:MAG: hypothetical protein DYG89_12745 [Caldilinea sp. CFX5]|nr:hypothetical protein [Caldilinea sp. CFX5]
MTALRTLIYKAMLIVILPLFLFSTLLLLHQKRGMAAPRAEPVRTRAVQGLLPGDAYAQIWLGLEPEFADAQITVLVEWDRLLPANHGLNFFIFDEQQLRRLGEEDGSFSALALAAGSANFALSTPDNVVGAGFRATGWATYALVLLNESPQAATFTLRVTNGFVTDGAHQVTVLDPPPQSAPVNTAAVVLTPTPLVTTAAFTETTMVDTINTLTVTTLPTPPPTPVMTPIQSPTPAIRPAARTSLGRNKRELTIKGTLATPHAQQLIRLKPHKVNAQLLLRLAPADVATMAPADATGLNFWVFDEVGFRQYLTGAEPDTLALTTGKAVFRSMSNERVAGFRAVDTAPYTVVIYSTQATFPISYTLRIEGAQVVETFYLP